jgi:signal transduction histidine kinase
VSSTSGAPAPRPAGFPRLLGPGPLTAGALVLAWLAFAAARAGHWALWPLGGLGTGLALLAFHRGRVIARERQRALERAVEIGAARNRELDLLHHLATALLSFRSPDEMFAEVARVARRLLMADGGAVMIRSEVGDFLRVAAGDGLLQAATGRLLPIEGSLAGWVVARGEPLRTDEMAKDPRDHPVDGLTLELTSAALFPLRSRGEVLGVVAAYNRSDGDPFTDHDAQLLQALGDQVAVGLDRAALVEDSRRKELALEQSNRELAEATRLKGQFLANMSHELRTPLNAIIGFSDLMLADDVALSETHRDHLESISRNGKHLLQLITSVLEVSKLEAGRMSTRLGRIDLRHVVRAAVADTESLRAVKRQSCSVDLGGGPMEVVADQGQLRQVLFNLLSNASKFTDDGGSIAVSAVPTRVPLPVPAERAGEMPGLQIREAAWVAVRDTGIGIAQEEIAKLFQAFSQVDASASRQQPGTGLGLALAKQLVELHGGTIGVESVPGQGSTFWFILPVDGPVRQRRESA